MCAANRRKLSVVNNKRLDIVRAPLRQVLPAGGPDFQLPLHV